MKESLSIQVSDPCHEDWKAMTPVEKGRLCNACSKVVVDFTLMTDQEIVRYFKETSGTSTCGRFMNIQLNRPLEGRFVTYPAYGRWIRLKNKAALFISGISLFLASCVRKPEIKGQVGKTILTVNADSIPATVKEDTIPVNLKQPHKKKKIRNEPVELKGEVDPYIITGVSIEIPADSI